MPDRVKGSNNGEGTNHVTPGTEEPKSSRENKDPKRTKVQTLNKFFKRLEKNNQENSQRNTVAKVLEKRTKAGKRLLPSGLMAVTRKERAKQSRKEVKEADEGETTNKTTYLVWDRRRQQQASPSTEISVEERAQGKDQNIQT